MQFAQVAVPNLFPDSAEPGAAGSPTLDQPQVNFQTTLQEAAGGFQFQAEGLPAGSGAPGAAESSQAQPVQGQQQPSQSDAQLAALQAQVEQLTTLLGRPANSGADPEKAQLLQENARLLEQIEQATTGAIAGQFKSARELMTPEMRAALGDNADAFTTLVDRVTAENSKVFATQTRALQKSLATANQESAARLAQLRGEMSDQLIDVTVNRATLSNPDFKNRYLDDNVAPGVPLTRRHALATAAAQGRGNAMLKSFASSFEAESKTPVAPKAITPRTQAAAPSAPAAGTTGAATPQTTALANIDKEIAKVRATPLTEQSLELRQNRIGRLFTQRRELEAAAATKTT